jgi:hypothetical protein
MTPPVVLPNDGEEEYIVEPTLDFDPFVHTKKHPFCIDPFCPDKEDQEAIGVVNQQYQDGLVTADEATRIVQGRGIRW